MRYLPPSWARELTIVLLALSCNILRPHSLQASCMPVSSGKSKLCPCAAGLLATMLTLADEDVPFPRPRSLLMSTASYYAAPCDSAAGVLARLMSTRISCPGAMSAADGGGRGVVVDRALAAIPRHVFGVLHVSHLERPCFYPLLPSALHRPFYLGADRHVKNVVRLMPAGRPYGRSALDRQLDWKAVPVP